MAGRCGVLHPHRSPFGRLRAGLGSTSVLSDESGQQAGERVAYLPYGGVRLGDAGTLPTDYGFTGQRNEAGLGLMHYGARFYSSRLGRFVSADSIVPEPGEPQALNRYSYVLGNPLRYTDPSGHYEFERDPDDPYIWYSDKPANTLIRCAEPVIFPEEFHQPTTGEVVRVVTAPFAAATVMAVASVMTAQFVVNGALGTAGYLGGVVLINAYEEGKLSLEGGSLEDAAASFITGGTTSVIPGEGFGPGFARGAAQAGSAYVLGQAMKGEPVSPGEAAASSVFGGLGGGVGDIAPGHLERFARRHIGAATAALTGKVGGVVAGPAGDAFASLATGLFTESLQNPSPTPPWTWPATPYTLP
jgi:RHS repeat-associated protein